MNILARLQIDCDDEAKLKGIDVSTLDTRQQSGGTRHCSPPSIIQELHICSAFAAAKGGEEWTGTPMSTR
jgi:hypothetical protein